MLIELYSFTGRMPKINDKQLPLGTAVEACNFRDDSGCIEPYKNYGEPVTPTTQALTFVVWPTSEDRTWPPGADDSYIYWNKRIDYCMGVSSGYDRIIYTGDGSPKIADPLVTPLVPSKLGISAPGTAPVAEEHTFDSSKTDIKNNLTSVCYCYTCVDNLGQESAPSPPSPVYDISSFTGGQGMRVSNMPEVGGDNNHIPQLRVYRATAGSGGDAEFLFVGNAAAGSVFDDYDTATGTFYTGQEAIQTTSWASPPSNLVGIVSMYGGVLAGFRKETNELCFSEPLVQYAWPEKYRIPMPQPILDIAGFGEELVVFMQSMIMAVRGEPGLMTVSEVYGGGGTSSVTRLGVVRSEKGILFPGHDGLYLYDGSVCINITSQAMSTTQWRSMLPDKFIAAYYDGKYWAFHEDTIKAYVFDISKGSVTSIELGELMSVKGVHADYHGRLWIQTWYKLYPWSEGTKPMEAVWMSGLVALASPVNLSAAIIDSDSPVTEETTVSQLEIWSHYRGVKTLVFDSIAKGLQIPLNNQFRLPGGFLTDSVQVKIKTTATIRGIRFATSMVELSGG